jgi:geranyl-CoA carboxylase beta subunit
MPVLETALNAAGADYAANVAAMRGLVAEFRRLEEKIVASSQAEASKFARRGQLLPRERISLLLDRGAPFVELATLAGLGMHDDDGKRHVMGGGGIHGMGFIAGKRVLVAANDSAIKGGTVAPMGLKKMLRSQEIAMRQKLPLVYLVESGGANLLYQSEIFVEGGRSFANQARLSAAGIPQVAVVHGSSTAGGAYLPGLSDIVVLVRGRSKIFLAGPPLVKAAIGEEATDEELGGAELHAEVTGLGEYLAEDDEHALFVTREIFGKMNWPAVQRRDATAPFYDAEDLLGVVPCDERQPIDMREVIARVVDGSDFLAYKPGFGSDVLCGQARICGHAVGIVANAGAIQPQGSAKAAQFIQTCDQLGTPLVFLQNTTGYMVGTEAERAGAVKHGSKMIQAVANARVAKLTVVIGGSFGAGNYGMCGRGFDPDFIFSWPSARTAVMGGAQAAKVMELITRAKFERSGETLDEAALGKMSEGMKQRLDNESRALFGTARLWDDGLIDPRDTRKILGFCLDTVAEAAAKPLRPSTFGVHRF